MSEQPLPAPKPDDQPIEAGEVGEIKELPFHEAQHRAETARRWPRGWSCSSQQAWVCIICWSAYWPTDSSETGRSILSWLGRSYSGGIAPGA
jgi:hypothetical protein